MGIRVTYTVQSCPRCGKRLLKQDATIIKIGSPLLHCRKCKQYYKTNMRQEWYQIKNKKWHIFQIPVLLMPVFGLAMLFTSKHILGLLVGALGGFIIGMILRIPEMFRLIGSMIRMRDPKYLRLLRDHGIISSDDYERRLDERIKNKV